MDACLTCAVAYRLARQILCRPRLDVQSCRNCPLQQPSSSWNSRLLSRWAVIHWPGRESYSRHVQWRPTYRSGREGAAARLMAHRAGIRGAPSDILAEPPRAETLVRVNRA
eukprot:13917082-Alexandrium_andersonii.AAC.1